MFPTTPLEAQIQEHPALLLRINELQFSVRTQRCLFSNQIAFVGDLAELTEEELLYIANFGRKSLREIVSTLGSLNLSLGLEISSWPPEDMGFLRKQYSDQIIAIKRELYVSMHPPTATCLEEELYELAHQSNERNTQIFIMRMGWDGNGEKTLDAVGKKYGVTRERIRQICSKIEKTIRLIHPPTNFVDRAIAHVNQSIPDTAFAIENGLSKQKISTKSFRIEGLITAANLLGYETSFDIESSGRKRIRLAIPFSLKGGAKLVRQEARKYVSHWGAGTVSDLIYKVNSDHKTVIPIPFATFVLESIEGFSWLDQESGWFWFRDSKRNRITNLIKKISSVADKLSLDELRGGIMRPYRMRGYSPPKRVLKAICEQLNGFYVQDNLVVAHPPLKWEKVLEGTNALDLAMALKIFGPVLTRSDFEHLCINKGMNRQSFYMYLGFSPLIQRYSRGVYGLRGADITSVDIEQLRKRNDRDTRCQIKSLVQNRVLQDFGRTTEGYIWVGYKLSENTVNSGVVTTPSPIQKYIAEEFSLYSTDKVLMGTLKSNQGSTWGLGPYFRRRGGEPGDYMLLLYDLKSKKATVELGDEDILERFSSAT